MSGYDETTIRADFPDGCPWLIQVPSGNPEPDFPSDLWTEVECGAPVHFEAPDGARCEAGHAYGNLEARWAPGGEEWQREAEERYEETGSYFGG